MLYKYLPTERIDVLENMAIRFSPLKSLNDPFESRPIYDVSDEISDVTRQAIEEFRTQKVYDDEGNLVTEEKFIATLSKLRTEKEKTPEFMKLGENMADDLTDRFGILSLSRTKSSLLMWSHYASQGDGFVISFDSTHDYFHRPDLEGRPTNPVPVTYSTDRPIFRNKDGECTDRIFCNKPLEWAYEQEERIFCMFDPTVPIEGVDKYGQNIRLSQIPQDSISGIYLGYYSSSDTEEKIRTALRKNKMHCPVYNGYISESEYRVEFEKKCT